MIVVWIVFLANLVYFGGVRLAPFLAKSVGWSVDWSVAWRGGGTFSADSSIVLLFGVFDIFFNGFCNDIHVSLAPHKELWDLAFESPRTRWSPKAGSCN